jgi:hypothetical protein
LCRGSVGDSRRRTMRRVVWRAVSIRDAGVNKCFGQPRPVLPGKY